MKSTSKFLNIVDTILFELEEAAKLLPLPLETPYGWVRRQRKVSRNVYSSTIRRLRNRGLVELVKKNNEKFLKLTKKGQLEVLLAKAKIPKPAKWDGKWRLFMFDIPERARAKRDRLRQLLKENNFYKLQQSVFVNPYPLNREAIAYLKQEGLMDYIRIMRVDDMDDPGVLKKKFGL